MELQDLIGDDYRLQWIIGQGGMSTVWLADDTVNNREVAIKVLRPEYTSNEEFRKRFRNEALAAEGIHSENVVATYDYREVSDNSQTFAFIVMEYVRGETLADMLAREGALSESLALDVLEQTAHGLSILHRQGLVHRDIKPSNLLITQNGQVKITDLGIAKAAEAVPLTRTGMVVGTAQYVSPEQAQGQEVGPGSDVYSLGVVGYEMLAGTRPFSRDTGISVALAHVNEAPPALSTTISAPARELIGICLRKSPNTRFANGNELALAVSAVRLGQRPPQPASAAMQQVAREPSPSASTAMLGRVARPTTTTPAGASAQPPKKKGGGVAIGIMLALLLAGAVAAGIYVLSSQQEPVTPPVETTTAPPEIITEWVTETEVVSPNTTATQPSSSREPTAEQTTTPTTASSTQTTTQPTTTTPTSTEQPADILNELGGEQGVLNGITE